MIADQHIRERFITELNQNFSVIAPAGSGKTRAIVERVIYIAKTKPEILSSLAVVTYTNKAAQEMRQRARKEIGDAKLPPAAISQFNRAFFGTIHSFCLKLLRQYGHHIGLPAQLDLMQDGDMPLFIDQLQFSETTSEVLKYISPFEILDLASQLKTSIAYSETSSPPPTIDIKNILECPPNKNKKSNAYIENRKQLAQAWLQNKTSFNPIPECTAGGKEIQARWKECFIPLQQWITDESLRLAVQTAKHYRQWRLGKGKLTYTDQIELAAELLQNPDAAKLIREQHFTVILDEAQDTDPDQFRVLLEMIRPSNATGDWIHSSEENPPRPGSFCMVGDPQQSIYGGRADLNFYKKIRSRLTSSNAEEITFDVTFRCGEKITQTVNKLGPDLLNGTNDQTSFVLLQTHQNSSKGQVARWEIPALIMPPEEKINIAQQSQHEADLIAERIAKTGLKKLRARQWSEVAVLCPRKKWFLPLERALRKNNIDVQIQSTNDKLSDDPFYRWLTALAVIMSEPRNNFEIFGVLREIYGIPDSHFAEFAQGKENPEIKKTLQELHDLRQRILKLPLRGAAEELALLAQQRVNSIPEIDSDPFLFDTILAQAAEAEAQDMTFTEWTESLRNNLETKTTEAEPRPDAIQLITCQKAKGLEWDAVILPFFFREIHDKISYPRIIRQIFQETPEFLLSKDHQTPEQKENLDLRSIQERQRLLYVSFTRARHTLIIADDAALFSNNKNSFGQCSPPIHFLDRKTSIDASASSKNNSPKKSKNKISPLIEKDFSNAQSFPFLARILPHTLAKPSLDSESPEQRLLELPKDSERLFAAERLTSLDYGLWWHQLCESLPWNENPSLWKNHFENRKPQPPFLERAENEWNLFLKSELFQQLEQNASNYIFHTEIPFLHPVNSTQCIEGIIDLAVLDKNNKSWLIIDWKTDSIDPNDLKSLKEKYSPQLQAYTNALKKLSGLPAQAILYSTFCAQTLKI